VIHVGNKLFKSKKLFILSIASISFLIGLFLVAGIIRPWERGYFSKKKSIAVEQQSGKKDTNKLEDLQHAYHQVAQKVLPAVVEIAKADMIKQQAPRSRSPFDFLVDSQGATKKAQKGEHKQLRLGSGVIVMRVGTQVYVLTNSHVVGKADEMSIRLYDRRQYKAKLFVKDPKKDIAIVVFKTSEDVPLAELDSSHKVQIGDIVFAVGNSMGFQSLITSGIVSAIGREPASGSEVAIFTHYIRTDAAINQSNSGGPLVNIYGQVVGINTLNPSLTEGSMDIGFSIPINEAKKAIEDFANTGKVKYGWLGVSVTDLKPHVYKGLGIEGLRGCFVYNVYKGSPADKAGILPGDFITEIDNQPIESATHFLFTVASLTPGRIYEFQLVRGGTAKKLSVAIAEETGKSKRDQRTKNLWPGMFIINITEDIQKQVALPKKSGNLIIAQVEKYTPASIAGLRSGDIIQTVNGKKVTSLSEFYETFNNNNADTITFGIYRQGQELKIGLER
jgi:Do/DeqQ family serine protease